MRDAAGKNDTPARVRAGLHHEGIIIVIQAGYFNKYLANNRQDTYSDITAVISSIFRFEYIYKSALHLLIN